MICFIRLDCFDYWVGLGLLFWFVYADINVLRKLFSGIKVLLSILSPCLGEKSGQCI